MTYIRVIPRDLFNEANLLKCYGQIYLNLERVECDAELVDDGSLANGQPFRVYQSPDDGSLSLMNVYLLAHGRRCNLMRPLNSRDPWPLWLELEDDAIRVFDDDGEFTAEMRAFLTKEGG